MVSARFAKIRKFLLRTLLVLLLLVGSAAILLRSTAVQTYLAHKGADWLSKELGATVRIGTVEFDFSKSINLTDVLVLDQAGDTMIYAHILALNIKDYDQLSKKINLFDVSLVQGFINIGRHVDAKAKNIDFLIEYFVPPGKKKGPVTGPSWHVNIQKVRIKDTRFYFFDDRAPPPEKGLLDESHLEFHHINGLATGLDIIEDSMHFTAVDVSAIERSGLEIESFNAICNVHNFGMDFTEMELQTPCSTIGDELHFKYPGYKYMDEFISNTQWLGKIRNSSICLQELSIFNEALIGNTEELYIDTDITGTFDKLHLKNTIARLGNTTEILGDLYMEGLPDWRTTYTKFHIRNARTNSYDISNLLNDLPMPKEFEILGNFGFQGDFEGRFLNFMVNGNIQTNNGNLQAENFSLDVENGMEKAVYSGRLITTDFEIQNLYSTRPQINRITMDARIKGTGFTENTFDMEIDAVIPSYLLNGVPYHNAVLKGRASHSEFTGHIASKDPRLDIVADGTINYAGAVPIFDAVVQMAGVDLYVLGLDTAHTLVWTTATINGSGASMKTLEGYVNLSNLRIEKHGESYFYETLWFQKRNLLNQSTISFGGGLGDLEMSGNFDVGQLAALVQNNLAQVFPERIKKVPYYGSDSFSFSLNIRETGLIMSYIDPTIKTSGMKIKGAFNARKGTMAITAEPFDIKYLQYQLIGVYLDVNKPDTSNLLFNVSARQLLTRKELKFQNMKLAGEARDSKAEFDFHVADETGENSVDLVAETMILRDSIPINLEKSRMRLFSNDWKVDKAARITVFDNMVKMNNVRLEGEDHYIQVHGTLSQKRDDTLKLDFSNLSFTTIKTFLPPSSADSLEAMMNGSVFITGVFGKARYFGHLDATDLKFGSYDFGNLNMKIVETEFPNIVGLYSRFTEGKLKGLSASGTISYKPEPGEDNFNLHFYIPKGTSLDMAQPFLEDIVTIKSGTLGSIGTLNLKGTIDEPLISGVVHVDTAVIMVDYLKADMRFSGEFFANKRGFFSTEPIKLLDEPGTGTALAEFSIVHNNHKNYYMDLNVRNINNFKILNTTPMDNSMYCGIGYADGNARISGPFDRMDMDIDLKTRKGTKLTLLYSDLEDNQIAGFVKFRNRRNGVQDTVAEVKTASNIHEIKINLDVTPEAEAQFLIDPKLGDVIRGTGRGKLRMFYDENENFFLYGNYNIESGMYVFSIPGINLLTKRIELEKGGTITWSGDPYNATLNVAGHVEKKISPATLMGGNSGNYPATRVIARLIMQGNLFKPTITFDIQTPELEKSGGSSANNVYALIQRIRADKDETMRQAVALILFGNFVPLTSNSNTSVISGVNVAGSSLSSLASNVANDIFARLGIPTRIQVNIDDVRNSQGQSNTKLFVASEWYLTDRLTLDVNLDPTTAVMVNNTALPLNFNLEYSLGRKWVLKAFSRSNNLTLIQGQSGTSTNTGVSGYTLGTGFLFRWDFETFARNKNKKEEKLKLEAKKDEEKDKDKALVLP